MEERSHVKKAQSQIKLCMCYLTLLLATVPRTGSWLSLATLVWSTSTSPGSWLLLGDSGENWNR